MQLNANALKVDEDVLVVFSAFFKYLSHCEEFLPSLNPVVHLELPFGHTASICFLLCW